MRQNNFIFDVDNNQVGIARAMCNEDPNQVKFESEMIENGQKFGLSDFINLNESTDCNHREINSQSEWGTVSNPKNSGAKGGKGTQE